MVRLDVRCKTDSLLNDKQGFYGGIYEKVLRCKNKMIEKCSTRIKNPGDDLDPLKVRKLYETISISTSDVDVV